MFKGLKGTVRARGNSWQVLYPYKDEDGEYKKRIKTCKTQTEALQVLRMFNQESADGVSMENVTMKKVFDGWIKEKKLSGSANTIAVYKHVGGQVVDYFGKKPIKKITRADVVKYIGELKENGTEPQYHKSVLSMLMNYAIKMRYTSTNPTLGIKVNRTKKERSAKILTKQERIDLLESLNGTIYYYMAAIALFTGLRLGELVGLKWDYIDLEAGTLEVAEQYTVHGQTDRLKSKNSHRTIDLDEVTVQVFKELKESPFTTSDTVFSNQQKIYDGFYGILRRRGLTPHDLRHNHATDLLDLMNHADAAYRMGHTVAEYIGTYVHTSPSTRKSTLSKMGENNKILFCNKSVAR